LLPRIKKRRNLNVGRRNRRRNVRERVDPTAVPATKGALREDRRDHRRRLNDRTTTVICHGRERPPLAVAPLTAAVYRPTVLALLIPVIGFVSLPSPRRRSTHGSAIALTTIATDADSEY
jgi:hypothetical protein